MYGPRLEVRTPNTALRKGCAMNTCSAYVASWLRGLKPSDSCSPTTRTEPQLGAPGCKVRTKSGRKSPLRVPVRGDFVVATHVGSWGGGFSFTPWADISSLVLQIAFAKRQNQLGYLALEKAGGLHVYSQVVRLYRNPSARESLRKMNPRINAASGVFSYQESQSRKFSIKVLHMWVALCSSLTISGNMTSAAESNS